MNRLVICGFLLISTPAYALCQQSENTAVEEARFSELALRYRSILQTRPQRGTAFDQWYRHYLDAGKLDELVAGVEREASEKSQDFAAQMILGLVLERREQPDRAAGAYARAERLAPDNYYPVFLRGLLLAQETRLEEATAELLRAIELGPPRAELIEISKKLAQLYLR